MPKLALVAMFLLPACVGRADVALEPAWVPRQERLLMEYAQSLRERERLLYGASKGLPRGVAPRTD